MKPGGRTFAPPVAAAGAMYSVFEFTLSGRSPA